MELFNRFLFSGNIAAAQKMLEKGIDINGRDEEGHFALRTAIESDKPEVLEFIIRNGANVNLIMDDGMTGLHAAIDYAIDGMLQNNRKEPFPASMQMIAILLDNGAELSIKDATGETPLDYINTYAGNIDSFNSLRSFFSAIIPDIDNRIYFNKK